MVLFIDLVPWKISTSSITISSVLDLTFDGSTALQYHGSSHHLLQQELAGRCLWIRRKHETGFVAKDCWWRWRLSAENSEDHQIAPQRLKTKALSLVPFKTYIADNSKWRPTPETSTSSMRMTPLRRSWISTIEERIVVDHVIWQSLLGERKWLYSFVLQKIPILQSRKIEFLGRKLA